MRITRPMTQALASDICIQIDELLPEYALGLLEPDEQALVSTNLAGCPDQSRQLAALDETVGLIGLAAPVQTVPDSLWQKIEADTVPARVSGSEPVRLQTWRERSMRVPGWLAAVAAILVLALVTSTLSLGYALRHREPYQNTMESTMAYYMTSGGSVLPLKSNAVPQEMNWSGKGALIVAPDMPPVLVVDDCRWIEKGSSYVVWLEADNKRTPMGQLSVDDSGRGMLTINGVDSLTSYDLIGVSVKMADGGFYDLMEGTPHGDI
jgi:hypothetical protein